LKLVPSRKNALQKNRKLFSEYKKTLECKHCGLKDHRVIEFHHVQNKEHNISRMVSSGLSWSRIENEIKKCIPLCCNCHRIEHFRLMEKEETNTVDRYETPGLVYLRLYW